MEIGDVIAVFGVGIPVILAVIQLRKANIQSRAQFIVNLLTKHTSDSEVLDLLYQIEYGEWEFIEEKFPHSKEERALDKLLYGFEQISVLYEMGTISRDDLRLIEYDFLRVFMSEEIQKYFSFLDRTPHGLPTDEADFHSYRRVAQLLVESFSRQRGIFN
ncbi:MAG: hypothetical protein RL120_15205 [Gammaproteobacteria bacterium]